MKHVGAAANAASADGRRSVPVSTQAAEEQRKGDYDRLVALANSQQRLLEARLRATRDEADRYRRDLETAARDRHNAARASVSLGDLHLAGNHGRPQHGASLSRAKAGRAGYQPSMPILPSGDHASQLSLPFGNLTAQLSVDLLNKERDDLVQVNNQLRVRVERYVARERELTEQMRHALELANRMQLERADALVRVSRADDELGNMRRLCDEQLAEAQRAITLERATFAIALERAGEPAELSARVRELEEANAMSTLRQERLSEENRVMREELARRVAATRDFEERAARIREELAANVTRACGLRDAAQQDAARAQRALERVSEQLEAERANNERVRTTHEAMLKRAEAQYDSLRAYAMHVAELVRANERRADEAVADRDRIVASHAEQLAALHADRETRERELLANVQHYQTRYETAAREVSFAPSRVSAFASPFICFLALTLTLHLYLFTTVFRN